jgi:hypothetical protein
MSDDRDNQRALRKIIKGMEATLVSMDEYSTWERLVDAMKQQWIIEGEWSQYHSMVAQGQGWGLSHVKGMWQVVTLDPARFADNEAARLYLLEHEKDQNSSLYAIAVQAVIVGNMR